MGEKQKEIPQKRKSSPGETTECASNVDSDAIKIVWARLKQKYLHRRIILTKSTCLKYQKETSKRIELINRRRCSSELLNLDMRISTIRKKYKKPNRFYQLGCSINLNSTNERIIEVNQFLEEIEKKHEHKTMYNFYNFMRGINIPVAYAHNIISGIQTGREIMSYCQNESKEFSPTNFNSVSAKDLVTNSKIGFKVNNGFLKKKNKHYDRAKQSSKSDHSNYGLRSHCKIIEVIRIFLIGKMLNLKFLNSTNKSYTKKYNNTNNSFNIINAVKKYSPLFSEKEIDNFLKNIVTPKTKKKLQERSSMNSLNIDGNKLPLHARRSSLKKKSHFNKKKCERTNRLKNYRTKLNACIQNYYNIQPGCNNNLMKFWNVSRNLKFNSFNKSKTLEVSNIRDFNLYKTKKPVGYFKCRKGNSLNLQKIRTKKSNEIITSHKMERSMSSTYIKLCLSNQRLKKSVRTNKINLPGNIISNREGKIPLDIIGTELLNTSISGNKSRLNLINYRKFSRFSYFHKTKLMNENGCQLFITDRVSKPNYLMINWKDVLIKNKIGIRISLSYPNLNRGKENIPSVKKFRSLPSIKYNTNKTFTIKSKIADLEERIKKSKAIINPIKSTITDYVINANNNKIIEYENKSAKIYTSSNATELSDCNLNDKPVRQLYKNPNFHKSLDGKNHNFIARNILSIKEASQRTRLKLNKEKEKKSEVTTERKRIKCRTHKFNKSVKTVFYKENSEGNDVESLSPCKENIKNISCSRQEIFKDSNGKSDIELKNTELANEIISGEPNETNLITNKYDVENYISEDDNRLNYLKSVGETDCRTHNQDKKKHLFKTELMFKNPSGDRERASDHFNTSNKFNAELMNNGEYNEIVKANEAISKAVDTDKILEKLAESCERFQNMQENVFFASKCITLKRNLLIQEPEFPRKDCKYPIESRRQCSFKLHNRLKKYNRGSESIDQLNLSTCKRKGRKLKNFEGKLTNELGTLDERELCDSRHRLKNEWSNEFYYKAHGMKNIKRTKKSPSETNLFEETQTFSLPLHWANKNEQCDSTINLQFKKFWPNGYSNDDYYNNFSTYSSNVLSEITNSTDSQENLDCETTSSSSDWLISEVFNVASCEWTKFISKERTKGKRFRKTRLKEYLNRFSTQLDQPFKDKNPTSTTKLSIFPPLLE